MMIRIFVVVVLSVLFCGCEQSSQPKLSFYYWKTVFELNPEEKRSLEKNEVTHLYIRYLDVIMKDGEAIPLSPVVFRESVGAMKVVPVVYIRNEVMLQPNVNSDELADKIIRFIDQINAANTIATNEVQIDCDWSAKSKEKYFEFLKQFKNRHRKALSVTIRLHQIKYLEKTGVPPADKGVLMYYNMGRIAAEASNSIYERKTAQKYLSRLREYPLHLDVALPVFSWGIHIRGNKVVGLVNKSDAATFENDPGFETVTLPFIEVKENTLKAGHYFLKGDRVKIEAITEEDLHGMAEDLKGKLKAKPHDIIIYDLDNFNLKRYNHEEHFFQSLCAGF